MRNLPKTERRRSGCENFLSSRVICKYEEKDFLVGNVDKYTIVVWMEGDDLECVDPSSEEVYSSPCTSIPDYEDGTNPPFEIRYDIKDTPDGRQAHQCGG